MISLGFKKTKTAHYTLTIQKDHWIVSLDGNSVTTSVTLL